MKLLTYKLHGDDRERLGVMCANAFQKFYPLENFNLHFRDMNELIEKITPQELQMLKNAVSDSNENTMDYNQVIHCAPIPHPRQDIICLGMNFADHAVESRRYKKEAFHRNHAYAVYFPKESTRLPLTGGLFLRIRGLWTVWITRRNWV